MPTRWPLSFSTLHQVERQQVSGGINMEFLDAHIANAYNNLTNIVLTVTPLAAWTEKAVLVSAHYDSLIGTVGMHAVPAWLCRHNAGRRPAHQQSEHLIWVLFIAGASDCASQVGVMLETARVLLSNADTQLAAPIVFLFIGGEETFSQAAHGFMQSNKRPLGVFLNLESTGPGGPDYVFQHTGKSRRRSY